MTPRTPPYAGLPDRISAERGLDLDGGRVACLEFDRIGERRLRLVLDARRLRSFALALWKEAAWVDGALGHPGSTVHDGLFRLDRTIDGLTRVSCIRFDVDDGSKEPHHLALKFEAPALRALALFAWDQAAGLDAGAAFPFRLPVTA